MPELNFEHIARRRRLAVLLAGAVGAFFILRWAAFVYVEYLWHDAVGYLDVYWKRTLWRWGLRLVTGSLVAVVVWGNIRVVASTLGAIRVRRRFANIEIAEHLPRAYLNAALVLVAALMGLWFSTAISLGVADRVLLFFGSQPWGQVDPVFGFDLGYYVFLLPLLSGTLAILLVLVFLVLALCVAGYAATGGLRWTQEGVEIGERTRIHLTSLIAVLLLLTGCRFLLARHLLLVDGHSAVQGIFGITDHLARLPAYQGLAVVSVLAAIGVAWGGFRNRAVPVLVGIAAVVFGGIVVGELYPAAFQRFRVVPNELARETPYIEWNLRSTREAFGLTSLQRMDFESSESIEPSTADVMAQFDGLPVWTPDALLTVLRSREARFTYYQFPELAIDRYPTPTGMLPVAISVREVALTSDQLLENRWVTLHLRERFLAGQGAVAANATIRTPEGRPEMLLSGIPPEPTEQGTEASGLALLQPQVFISGTAQQYAIITPGDSAFLSPEGRLGQPGIDFPRGISLGSWVRRIALAWWFLDVNLLVSSEITGESRFVFRRRAVERVKTLAPFLQVLDTPYPVVYEGRIVWIVEGFTSSATLPLASPVSGTFGRARYLRNSVKATVDAVTGEVVLYRTSTDDPIVDAYSRAFPTLFKPLAEMPAGLLSHIRYPPELLSAQARVLTRYHQESPAVFYGQQDVWSVAQEQSRNDILIEYPPTYGLYRLPGDSEEGFHLTTVFVPEERPNLTAVLVARSDPDRFGELLLLDVPVEDQVPGPRQVEALVDQDPDISQQLSLWRQGGSQVWLGHLHVIPVGDRFLYMEPVFLAASDDAIPALTRFIVSDGRRVAMRDGLIEAVNALWGGVTSPELRNTVVTGLEGDEPSGSGAAAALALLQEAESLLRQGDWAGYGAALDRLRILLERLASG